MPLRGSLFKKIEKARAVRRAKQLAASREEAKREGVELKELRKRRVQQEGKTLLEETLREEKTRISTAKIREKRAKGPRTATRIGKFLLGKATGPTAKKGARVGAKFIAKELGLVKTKKRGPKRKKRKGTKKTTSALGSGPFI